MIRRLLPALALAVLAGCTVPSALPVSDPPASSSVVTTPASVTAEPEPTEVVAPGEWATVERIIDGDTIIVLLEPGGAEARVRLLGVNSVERGECGFREATEFVADLIPPGTQVRLVVDDSQGDRDRYDRLLRYVTVPVSDGASIDLSTALAEAGWAEHYDRFPVSKSPSIRAAEQGAKDAQRGVWAVCQ